MGILSGESLGGVVVGVVGLGQEYSREEFSPGLGFSLGMRAGCRLLVFSQQEPLLGGFWSLCRAEPRVEWMRDERLCRLTNWDSYLGFLPA